MATDVEKHLQRAKKYLEKNKLQDATESYLAALEVQPANLEVMQALGDLYSRQSQAERASVYYGMLFDKLVEARDLSKASALFGRFLRGSQQPPDRLARFAVLLQKQNKIEEAIECYSEAAEIYLKHGQNTEVLNCLERVAQLDPDNPSRHIKLAELGERLGRNDLAARGYLRAGQLALMNGEIERSLDFLGNAHRIEPDDRSTTLFYASACLRNGNGNTAVQLLDSFPQEENDPLFLDTFGQALLLAGQLDRAAEMLWRLYAQKEESHDKLFALAARYFRAGESEKGIGLLSQLKEKMESARLQSEFAAHLDPVVEANPKSIPLVEFWAASYNELNREAKYFDALARLFDLYIEAGNLTGARDSLDRLVDIDAYDFGNQRRIEELEKRLPPEQLRGLNSRLARVGTAADAPAVAAPDEAATATAPTDEARARQTLDDLLVQAEIFLQYSLRPKALERLQKIAEMFPGEEEKNARLRSLYETADWWPPGSTVRLASAETEEHELSKPTTKSGVYSAETLRDLAKITEISRTIYRQSSPKAVLSSAVNEIGSYMNVTRCLAVIGAPGQSPQMASEFCASGIEPSPGSVVIRLLNEIARAESNALGGFEIDVSDFPILREAGLTSLLAVPITDKETQATAGMLVVGHTAHRNWKPYESYFLQAVGDQVLISYNHTKLRSLVRNLAVADERTGLLNRSSYQDCLLAEMNRAKTQSSALSLVILQVDRGPELVQHQGEAPVERHMEQLARAFQAGVRQNDLAVKYTAWSLAFILPDTGLAGALHLADKLRKAGTSLKTSWEEPASISGAVVECSSRLDYDGEDLVTDLMNRAEFSLEEARKKGGNTLISL